MPEIRIYANERGSGGPPKLSDYYAHIKKIEHGPFKGANSLRISVGDTDLRIWPADKDKIKEFGEKLIKIAEEL